MLSAAFSNRLVVPSAASASSSAPPQQHHAAVVVVSDSELEPSLGILSHFVRSAFEPASSPRARREGEGDSVARGDKVVLLCLEQSPDRILRLGSESPAGFDPSRLEIIDATLSGPYHHQAAASRSAPAAARQHRVDLSLPDGLSTLLEAVQAAIIGNHDNHHDDDDSASSTAGKKRQRRPVTVVIDSVNALVDSCATGNGDGVAAASRCLKRIWQALRGRRGSRLVVVHHDDFPAAPPVASTSTTPAAAVPSLLAYLLSPSFSPSTLHLTLRPSAHVELLSREYGLAPDPDRIASDPRTKGYLDSLAARRVGNPWARPGRHEEVDERIERGRLVGLVVGAGRGEPEEGLEAEQGAERGGGGSGGGSGSGGKGGCVVEWSCRGLDEGSYPGLGPGPAAARGGGGGYRSAARGGPDPSTARTAATTTTTTTSTESRRGGVVRMGYTAAQVVLSRPQRRQGRDGEETGFEVREVPLGAVLDPKKMGVRAGGRGGGGEPSPRRRSSDALPASTNTTTTTPSAAESMALSSSAATDATTTALPFSLDLTEQQRLARSRVPNPYAGTDKPIYGEEGYRVPVVPGLGVAGGTGSGGGGVEYVADRGDDLDEEDPDEDLEL
ncbi:hypothetical protein JCM3774_005498 [Rhodotorula dairenensis]